jgi:ligand-binding sensor domain-containing protein/two-component sensor histidine kinase
LRKTFLTLLLSLPVVLIAKGQLSQYRFTHIATEDGLAHSSVNHITQDNKGFIWIATHNGLQRYDGYRFFNYHFEFNNNNSLPSDVVIKLLQDDKKRMWVACNEGMAVIDPLLQNPKRIPMDLPGENVSMEITGLFQDSRKRIWLTTRPYGAFVYDEAANKFVRAFKTNPFNWKISLLAEDPGTGNFWLGCDSGLAYHDVKRNAFYNRKHNPLDIAILRYPELYGASITGMAIDSNRQMWVNTFWSGYPLRNTSRSDFFRYDIFNKTVTTYEPPANEVHQYASDSKTNTWLLGENIFSKKNEDSDVFETVSADQADPYGMDAQRVNCLLEDKQHNYWLGTDNGIYIFNPAEMKISRGFPFDDNKKPINTPVQQFLQLANGNIWMATWGGGLFEYDYYFKPARRYWFDGDGGYNMIWSMHRAADGKIWLGCQAGLLMRYDPATKAFEKMAPPAFDLRTIRTITEDHDGNIWFGTQHGLIVKYDVAKKDFIRYAEPSYPRKEVWGNINKLVVDQQNNLWACTNSNGLMKFDVATGKVVEQFLHNEKDPNSLSGTGVANLLEYNDSLMMLSATGINVFNLNTKKFTYIGTHDGLPSNSVLSLQKDAAGNIWAGFNGALVKMRWPSKKVEVYGREDGILNTSFESNAMQVLQGGKIAAGTSKDFIYFNPLQFHSRHAPPDVQITGLKAFDNRLNIDSFLARDKAINLSYDQNFITIEFSALSFLDNKLTYYYKLEGIDKDWIKASRNLAASYTHLPGGHYTFQVRCENGDGIQSLNIGTLKINIPPPFWLRWWFFLLLAIAFAYVLYFFHRLRINRLLDMEKVRDRIARDLHDDMGSTLSTINILSEMVKMKIDKDLPTTKDYINKIGDNTTRMMEAMDDIVWSINPMNDNMQKITARMREYATSMLEARDIDYTIHVDEAVKQIKLDMEARRDFFLIFKEAVNNLAKYSKCTKARINIETYDYTMLMKIKDNGVGFIVSEADNGNGLTNMQKRAKSLNAKLSIESQPGVGTTILLEVIFA